MSALFGEAGLHLKDTTATCSLLDRVTLGIDTALPLITTPAASTCLINPNVQGQALGIIGIFLQLAGWATATLFVAGFTGAVRKT